MQVIGDYGSGKALGDILAADRGLCIGDGALCYGRRMKSNRSRDRVSELFSERPLKFLLGFAVLMNDNSKTPGSMKPWQNFFGQALADFNRKTPLSEQPSSPPGSDDSTQTSIEN